MKPLLPQHHLLQAQWVQVQVCHCCCGQRNRPLGEKSSKCLRIALRACLGGARTGGDPRQVCTAPRAPGLSTSPPTATHVGDHPKGHQAAPSLRSPTCQGPPQHLSPPGCPLHSGTVGRAGAGERWAAQAQTSSLCPVPAERPNTAAARRDCKPPIKDSKPRTAPGPGPSTERGDKPAHHGEC